MDFAAQAVTQSPDAKPRQVVGFTIGDEEFGVEILQVREIIRMQELTRVPSAPAFVEGMMNLRGSVIPILSLRKRLGFEQSDHAEQTRIVVLEAGKILVGFIIDAVSEVLRIPPDAISPAPRIGRVEREFVSGVGKLDDRLVILLDAERIVIEAGIEISGTAGA